MILKIIQANCWDSRSTNTVIYFYCPCRLCALGKSDDIPWLMSNGDWSEGGQVIYHDFIYSKVEDGKQWRKDYFHPVNSIWKKRDRQSRVVYYISWHSFKWFCWNNNDSSCKQDRWSRSSWPRNTTSFALLTYPAKVT